MKTILTLTTLLLIHIALSAQISGIGIKSGVSISSTDNYILKDSENPKVTTKTGFTGGITFENIINNTFSFQYELQYESKGFYFPNDVRMDGGPNIFGYFNTQCITIPLLIKATGGKAVQYYGYCGLYAGFLIRVDNSIRSISASFDGQTIEDLSYNSVDQFNRFDWGGIAGTGLRTSVSEMVDFVFDVRCNVGLSHIAKENQPNTTSPWKYYFQEEKNVSIAITAGIVFNPF